MKRTWPYMAGVMAIGIFATYLFSLRSADAGLQLSRSGYGVVSTINPVKVDRLDASANHIIPTDASLEKIADGFTWVEGPIWIKDSLFFAEIPSNSIRKWTPGAGVSVFLQPSGYKGSAPYGGPEPGSNGMTLDHAGRLTVAGHAH